MARTRPPDRFDEIVRGATRVFLEQGYRRTQMADIAQQLGLAKGTLYLYVESKEALFDVVVRSADVRERVPAPDELPVPSPPPASTMRLVERRLSESAHLPALSAALARRRVDDARAELRAVVRELYTVLSEHRVGIKLLDRCALDQPELAELWYRGARGGVLHLLSQYLGDRARRRKLRLVGGDASISARFLLETVVFWAVHRHWDPAPEVLDDSRAQDAVVEFVTRGLAG